MPQKRPPPKTERKNGERQPRKKAADRPPVAPRRHALGVKGSVTKLTPEVIDLVCARVQKGATYEVAAIAVGVHKETITDWKKRGKDEPDSIFADFSLALARAEADGEVYMLSEIGKSGAAGMQWILGKRHPERYGDTTRIKVEVEKTIDEMLNALESESEEVRDRVLARLASR